MGKAKSLKDKLWGAAVLKQSFLFRSGPDSAAFKAIYPGVLRDLGLDAADVDRYLDENREAVDKAARGTVQPPDDGDDG